MKDKLMEKIAMNIVFQIGDLLYEALPKDIAHKYFVDARQKTNDKAIDFVKALITSEVEKERERLLKEVEEKVIGDEDYAGKEFMGKFGVEMMGEDEAEHRNYLKKEQRKALSDIGGENGPR